MVETAARFRCRIPLRQVEQKTELPFPINGIRKMGGQCASNIKFANFRWQAIVDVVDKTD